MSKEPLQGETSEDYWDLIAPTGIGGGWELFGKRLDKQSAKNQAANANGMFPLADVRAVHVTTSMRFTEED